MIQFNVTPSRTPTGHTPSESLMERTSRWWRCADARLDEYGDVALAVEHNRVVGAFLICGYWRDAASDNKVVLDLAVLPDAHPARSWIGHAAPVPWTPGQRQPFKYISWRGLVPLPSILGQPDGQGSTSDLGD